MTTNAETIAELVPVTTGLAGPLLLRKGETLSLGRALLANHDSRCSRRQLDLLITPSLSITATLRGTNVSSIRQPGCSSFEPMRPGVAVVLESGAILALLGDEYRFELRLTTPSSASSLTHEPDPKRSRPEEAATTANGTWSSAIAGYLHNPEQFVAAGIVVAITADVVVIRDRFPKSQIHLLAMSRALDAPARPADLRKRHSGIVRALLDAATHAAADEVLRLHLTGEAARIRFGFHQAPSLTPMHLHAIGQDFAGPSLKTAKHWNSFTSTFFVEALLVIAMLDGAHDETEAAASIAGVFGDKQAAKQLLKQSLRCHRCGAELRNMPLLKVHIASCMPGVSKEH